MKNRSLLLKVLSAVCSATMLCACIPFGASAEKANPSPNVIPAIREWEGGTGSFVLQNGMRVVLSENTSLSDKKKEIITGYFAHLFDMDVEVVSGDAKDGDILLVAQADDTLGKDGYTLDVTEKRITVTAPSEIGLLYGVTTILQSCVADGFMPVGKARDYSAYEVRGGMLDVARAWIPMDYLTEITQYAAWFKINRFHVHVSDNNAFRLESDIEGLASADGYYTKEEYRAYQLEMKEYGVDVITEIDTPAHSACIGKVVPQYMMDNVHIDIENPDAIQFVKDLYAEYLTGDNPVILSDHFHIGTDEYTAGHEEQMRAYTDEMLKYVRSLGYTPMFWGSFSEKGQGGFYGTTPVTSDAEAYFWAYGISDHKMLLDMGYPIINIYGPILYVVPGGNYGFADYYNLESLYVSWFVNQMGYGANNIIDADHPQLLGGSFALWNDLSPSGVGFSYFDIFDRIRGQVCLMAEKTWCGEQTRKLTADWFVSRYDALSAFGGDTDPGRHMPEDIDGEIPADTDSFGWPYTASMNVTVGAKGTVTTILEGKDGKFYIDSNGMASLARENYVFTFDHKFTEGEERKIELIADNKETVMVIDDTYFYPAINHKNSTTHSTTFVLPLETVGETVTNLKVRHGAKEIGHLLIGKSLAEGKTVTVSGLEVDTGQFLPEFAVDNNPDSRVSFARDKDEQWMLIDLGEIQKVNRVEITFYEHISDYSVLVSRDGEEFIEVARIQQGEDKAKQTDKVTFETVEARYIRYEQHKRFYIPDWNAYYSGGITEFGVFYDDESYKDILREANDLLDRDCPQSYRNALQALSNYVRKDRMYTTHLAVLIETMQSEIDAYKQSLENQDSSDVSTETSTESVPTVQENPQKGISPLVWAGIAVGACALIGGALWIIKKKKK